MLTPNGKRLSASQLDRAMRCLHPWVSPLEWRETTGPAAVFGTALHKHHEEYFRLDPWERSSTGELRAKYGVAPRDARRFDTQCAEWESWVIGRPEYALPELVEAKISLTGTVHTTTGARDYGAFPDDQLVGTCDVAHDGIVTDWKSGGFTHPADSWQMRFLAIAYAAHKGSHTVTARIVAEREGMRPQVIDFKFVPDALGRLREDIERRVLLPLAQPDSVRPTPTADGCKYCPLAYTGGCADRA